MSSRPTAGPSPRQWILLICLFVVSLPAVTPRMIICERPEPGLKMPRLGTLEIRSVKFCEPALVISLPSIAEMLIATFCSDSERLFAVTVTVSSDADEASAFASAGLACGLGLAAASAANAVCVAPTANAASAQKTAWAILLRAGRDKEGRADCVFIVFPRGEWSGQMTASCRYCGSTWQAGLANARNTST